MAMFNPAHPGEILKELVIDSLELTITDVAKHLDVSRKTLSKILNANELSLINYTKKLTIKANDIIEADIINLRQLGINDGEILEVNQVVSYFNYANRTVLGLGVNTDKEILGLSPKNKDDESSWDHK